MKSWEILRDAIDKVGVKALAAKLNLSTALVYKWCQQPEEEDPGASGALNPLDRLKTIYEVTRDERLINWLCNVADGFYTRNPAVRGGHEEEQLLTMTQRVVHEFSTLLSDISRGIENDGQINADEAEGIRQSWERLKGLAEQFVVAGEKGLYTKH